jgi:glycosyltransferase involved in cell wall biosynthesis
LILPRPSGRGSAAARREAGRVLIVIENVPLAHDHRARKQVRSLLAAGYAVSVITRRHDGNTPYRQVAGLRLHEYRPPPDLSGKLSFVYEYAYSLVAASFLAIRAFLREGFDAIQVGNPPDAHFVLALPARLAGRPFVVDQRDLSPEVYADRYGRRRGFVPWLLGRLERWSWRAADHVLCVNESLRGAIVERGGLAPASVTVVGNGPELGRTAPRPGRPELKEGRPFLVCWLGLMGAQDHVDLALHAAHHLVHELGRRDCHFAFIGEGEMLPALRSLAARLDLADRVTFTGWLDEDACFDYLATADVALDSNLQAEVSPVKGMEYMAFGVPFVAFDLPETRAMAEAGAVFVPPGDPVALARAVADLLDDPKLRAILGQAGMRRISQTLAWDRQCERYLGVYERLLPHDDAASGARGKGGFRQATAGAAGGA